MESDATTSTGGYPGGPRAAFAAGAGEAFGVPAGVLGAGFLGYGALAGSAGASVAFTWISTLAIWALPGQLILLEMWQVGAPLLAVALAVMLANARFLPMAMTLIPVLRDASHPRWRYYVAAHFVAMTAWAASMRRCPELPPAQRMAYFTGFGMTCLAVCMVTGALGYALAGSIPRTIQLGLLFLAPVYFLVLLVGEVRTRMTALALACGALAGPLCHVVTPQWGGLLAGLIGGSIAFALAKWRETTRV